MKPSRFTLMGILLLVPLFIYGSIAIGGADDQATVRAPGAGLPGAGAGFESPLTPGDILWSCDMHYACNDSDNQIFGVEFDGQFYYVAGGGGTYYFPDDTNKVYIWHKVGGACQCSCAVNQPTLVTSWGWYDLCYDGNYLYGAGGSTPYVAEAFTADCDSVTLYPSHNITLTPANFPGLGGILALAYDRNNGWFWTAQFSSPIYAFDRTGARKDSIGNTYDIAGLAYDDISPGGPYLWAHTQDGVKIRQIDLATKQYTGVVYSGFGDDRGVAGGLCLDRSGCGELVGISQLDIGGKGFGGDTLYAVELLNTANFTNLDTTYVPWKTISQNSNNVPILGFRIDCVQPNDCLESVIIRSFITKKFSVDTVRLYVETNGTKGLQVGADELVVSKSTYGQGFDSNDTLVLNSLHYCLNDNPGDSNLFYITINAHTDSVSASPALYEDQCLEVVIDPGRIKMDLGGTNPYMIYNRPYGGAGDDSTGFCPIDPNDPGSNCRYRLCFDVLGPQFDLFLCVPHEEVCPDDTTIAQEDSVQICATNVSPDIKGPITIIDSKKIFLLQDIKLRIDDSTETGACPNCDTNYNVIFQIPDKKNTAEYPGIDADTGQWMLCAWAEDNSGNKDTICISHDDLPWKIDTRKPIIDSVTYDFFYDANGDGIIALGDSIMVIGWGLSNPWYPQLEVDSMKVDMSWFCLDTILLDDVLNNNRVFRKKIGFDVPCCIDTQDCDVNRMTVIAWDNACNYDTLPSCIEHHVDLDMPDLDSVVYEYYLDVDTTYACIGIGDKVKIKAFVDGKDIASVTADMKDAGIDEQNREALSLPYRSGALYDTIWTVTEPPIDDGKDRNNSDPPPIDQDFSVKVTACDDAGNCTTGVSGQLNRELDTRVPRPVGFACPESVPCALHARSLPGARIELYWDKDCDELDAWMFYVYGDGGSGTFDSIGSTYDGECLYSNFNCWTSEPLAEGYWLFKIKTEDDCGNVADDFSCVVGAYSDSTPPWACLVYPDNFGTYGAPFAVKARADQSVHPDIESVYLWYRLWPNYPDEAGRGPWTLCSMGMYRPEEGYVFFDTIDCIHDFQGWVELLPQACDEIGNCQSLDRAYAEACLDDESQNIPVSGHFFFEWDTTRAVVRVDSVNGFVSPQSPCGFDVWADSMNTVVISVPEAEEGDLFTVDVRGLVDDEGHCIHYENHVSMPFAIDFSVQNWPAGTKNLYIYVVEEATGDTTIPAPLIIELCVPPQYAPCMEIVAPHEWQRIPCSKTDLTCVNIWAGLIEGCPDTLVTQVKFFWAKSPDGPWYFIDEVLEKNLGYWKTCWNNKKFLDNSTLVDGDAVYFMVIGYNQYHVPDTSELVKVFLDCEAPQVKLIIEDIITTCGDSLLDGIPKVSGDITLKAEIIDTLVDVVDVVFFYKLHSDPDLPANWDQMCDGVPAWHENIYMCTYNTNNLTNNTWYDIRISVADQAGNVWLDFDENGDFDDSTFFLAVAAGAGITVFVDNEAPQPAISMVADPAASIYNVNPSTWLNGNGSAYVKAFDDITAEISVLPSEDSCEVMKVEWFLCLQEDMEPSPMQGRDARGSGAFGMPGDDCGDPIPINLPADLPFDERDSTCNRNNDYDKTSLLAYDAGEDIVYQLNVTLPVDISIVLDPNRTNTGMVLSDACPPCSLNHPCLRQAYRSSDVTYGWYDVHLDPGTYYLMVDSRQEGWPFGCISGFDLAIEGGPSKCVHVGTSTDPYHFPVTFNPVTAGLIEPWELEDGWWFGYLKAKLYDSLGNSQEDMVGLYILDVTPSQAVIIEPENDSYVWGDVTLRSLALNAYEICELCYEYRPEGDTLWYPVNEGYPNACATVGEMFELVWHTLNTIEDGVYYLRAKATDCSNNVDSLPPTIRVTVANGMPTVELEDLDTTCWRTCPDDTVEIRYFVGDTVTLYATASSDDIPIDRVVFMYKNIFAYPDTGWKTIGLPDYFPTGGKYSVEWITNGVPDGRYYLKARAYNAAGRYADSDPVEVSVDNTPPLTQVISIMGEPNPPGGIDISKGDIIDIEVFAMDSTSPEGWTRCYNSGVYTIEVCISRCGSSGEITKCFEVNPTGDPPYDGYHTIQWNTSGLEIHPDSLCGDCYYVYVKATDCLGNDSSSDSVKVRVSDIKAPITTIAGFDSTYIYGYSTESVKTLLFEYADSGSTNWIPIGWSSFIDTLDCNGSYMYLYQTSWDPSNSDLSEDSVYQIRVISHDICSNQDDDMAPIAYFTVSVGEVMPYNPEVLGSISFLKNWCVGGMHGVVLQDVETGDPMMLARYLNSSGSYSYECVEMQAHLQNSTEYAGSFYARAIDDGGSAEFFSSVTMLVSPPPMTGDPTSVTYLRSGTFDIVKVKCDLGTHGVYQDGCVELTIPDGAIDCSGPDAEYVWVSPTYMEWAPVTQPDILPIGDDNGYATYVSFTDCYYCCGFGSPYFDGNDPTPVGAGSADGDGDRCCFRDGKYAKIKICYDSSIDLTEDQLAVAWWDCKAGEYSFDSVYYPSWVDGFNTEEHWVEFATSCLKGPFVVVKLLDRGCPNTTLQVAFRDIWPYCDGYTNSTPKFTSVIKDRVQGTSGINESSIRFKIDDDVIYDGSKQSSEESCDMWAAGFGNFALPGWDPVSGLFRVAWSENNSQYPCYYDDCGYQDDYHRFPAEPLAAGEHTAEVSAENINIQFCKRTLDFIVDATEPNLLFADSAGAYVGKNPHFCMYIWDTESGIAKDSIWIDIFSDDYSDPYPAQHDFVSKIAPDQLKTMWNGDTLCVDLTFEHSYGGYLHVYVYDGNKCGDNCPDAQYTNYFYGVSDCVGNKRNVDWRYFTIDAYGPTISFVGDDYCEELLQFEITDALSGLLSVYVYEDSTLVDSIQPDPHNPNFWWYDPSEGVKRVDIKATDNIGNVSVYSFDLPSDCGAPTVIFADKYVGKNPTIRFWVTDPCGVDWTTVNAWITGCNEECYYPYSSLINNYANTLTGEVTLSGCNIDCSDNERVYLYVHSDTTSDWRNHISWGEARGPFDLCGNYLPSPAKCTYVVDAYGPTAQVPSTAERPIRIYIKDLTINDPTKEGSGVDWSSLEFYEDSILICEGLGCTDNTVTIDTIAGVIVYDAPAGMKSVYIHIWDRVGNYLQGAYINGDDYDDWQSILAFYTEAEKLSFGNPHNYPNPFDPRNGEVTRICPGLNKTAYVTIKIYDFAGEYVTTLKNAAELHVDDKVLWDGTTEGSTEVANGTYLCYIKAKDPDGTRTAVIKITVLKQDK